MGSRRANNGRLVLIDGFAGPGIYKGGEPGSPIIMLKAFLEHAARDEITSNLAFFFIEENAARAARLEREIKRLGKLPKNVEYEVRNDSYAQAFSEVLDDIEERGTSLAPTFAFLDPFGYSDAPMSMSGRFLEFRGCEVLIYVPLKSVNRWLRREGQERAMMTLFGTDEWVQAVAIADGQERLRFLHDLFYRQLKTECGLSYVRSFEIVTAAPNSGYHLFFGTNHLTGLKRMKETMWKVDPVEGRRFHDSTRPGALVLFEEEPDTRPLENALRKRFGTKPFAIEQAEEFTLVETPYVKKHLRKPILKPLEGDEQLEIVRAKPNRRRYQYPDGTVVRFSD